MTSSKGHDPVDTNNIVSTVQDKAHWGPKDASIQINLTNFVKKFVCYYEI